MSEEQAEKKAQGIQGVFSSQEVRKVGTGTTTRKTIQKAYWYATELPGGDVEVQPLNVNYIPSGPKKHVPREEFLKAFAPEVEFYVSNVFPKIKEINKTIARADRHRTNKEYYSAEMEYGNALRVDEENIRANFGLGLTYLERGENSKAEDILTRLVRLEGTFEPEHKHLFNDFGINLRKNRMYDQSISYYTRALELSAQDENLRYNLARAHLEKKDINACLDSLLRGLEINPAHPTLVQFLMWLVSKRLVPDAKKNQAAAALQQAKTAQAAAPQTLPRDPAPAAPESGGTGDDP